MKGIPYVFFSYMCFTRQGGKFSGMTLDIKFFDQNVRGLRQNIKRTKIFLQAERLLLCSTVPDLGRACSTVPNLGRATFNFAI